MFVGVVVENFHKCRQHQEVEEAKRREEKRQRRMEKKRRSKREDWEQERGIEYESRETEDRQEQSGTKEQAGGVLYSKNVEDQMKNYYTHKTTMYNDTKHKVPENKSLNCSLYPFCYYDTSQKSFSISV